MKYTVVSQSELANELNVHPQRVGQIALRFEKDFNNYYSPIDALKIKAYDPENAIGNHSVIWGQVHFHFYHSKLNFVEDVDDL